MSSGSGSRVDRIATVLAPSTYTRIAGTGSTEASNATALTSQKQATLLNGSVPVRVTWAGAASLTSQVSATTSVLVGPYGTVPDWEVRGGVDDFVYAEANDGSSAFELWVWTSSP